MQFLQKCLILVCVFFMMCPKRSSFSSLSRIVHKIFKPNQNKVIKSPLRQNMPRISHENDNSNQNNDDSGEMLLPRDKQSKVFFVVPEHGFDLTDAEIAKLKIWPRGIIPYFIDDYSFDKVLRNRIRGFLDSVNTASGLNFIELPHPPKDENSRWLFFLNRRGLLECADISTKNFTNSGVQKLVLGYNCLSSGALAEIVLAIVGVPAQHNAPNRNEYVSVQTANMMPSKKYLFDVLKNDEWLFHDIEYDFASAGHYGFHKYTVNGFATLQPLERVDIPVGESDGFSSTDILKIRMLYNYISRSKQTEVPECHKLFEPGAFFDSFQPKNEEEVEPRKKPNRYLGLPDDKPEFIDYTKLQNKNQKGQNNKDGDKDNDTDGDKDNDTDGNKGDDKDGNTDSDQKEKEENVANEKEPRVNRMLKKKYKKKGQLSYRSDYATDEKK